MDKNLEVKEEKEKGDDLYRITMTRDAEKALGDLLEKVNSGFIGGKINRTQLVSWALMNLNREITENQLQDLRAAHFDDLSALELLYRKAKESGVVSSDLKAILMKEIGFDAPTKKGVKQKIDKQIHQ